MCCCVSAGVTSRFIRTALVKHTLLIYIHSLSLKAQDLKFPVIVLWLRVCVCVCVSGSLVTWTGPVLKLCWRLAPTGRFLCDRKMPENSPSASSTVNTSNTLTDSCQSNCTSDTPLCLCLRFNMDTRHIKVTYSEGLYRINEKKAFKGLYVSDHTAIIVSYCNSYCYSYP